MSIYRCGRFCRKRGWRRCDLATGRILRSCARGEDGGGRVGLCLGMDICARQWSTTKRKGKEIRSILLRGTPISPRNHSDLINLTTPQPLLSWRRDHIVGRLHHPRSVHLSAHDHQTQKIETVELESETGLTDLLVGLKRRIRHLSPINFDRIFFVTQN